MRSKRKGGAILITIGLLCIVTALVLVGYNLIDEHRAGETSEYVLTKLKEQMPSSSVAVNGGQSASEQDKTGQQLERPDYILNPDMEMPVIEIEGNAYIGILDIPTLGISLPIMSEWSYPQLKIAPCRYSGSAYTGNFAIAGHNYSTHFGSIGSLKSGDQIIFTDTKGRVFKYEVRTVETLEATAIEDMISDEWDLTLFTCTSSGQARITVRCLSAD